MGRKLGCERGAELSVALVDASSMSELNLKYRGSDVATDVLSFPQETMDEVERDRPDGLLGDVVINVDAAARQAGERGHSTSSELDLLAAHGLLHLLGYSHGDGGSAAEMREAERMLVGGSIIDEGTGEV
jgi:probable rRNA maturation factor